MHCFVRKHTATHADCITLQHTATHTHTFDVTWPGMRCCVRASTGRKTMSFWRSNATCGRSQKKSLRLVLHSERERVRARTCASESEREINTEVQREERQREGEREKGERDRQCVWFVLLSTLNPQCILSGEREWGLACEGVRRSVGGKDRPGCGIPLHGVYCAFLVGLFSAAGGVQVHVHLHAGGVQVHVWFRCK